MRIAVLGSTGQLGTELCAKLGAQVRAWCRPAIDLTSRDSLQAALDQEPVDLVINAAAYNKVDLAEDQPQQAYLENALGPRLLALECAVRDITLMHVSTDYVFGLDLQRQVPYRESDAPGPASAYGLSKLAGEYYVRALCPKHFVIRTCGLYGHAARTGAGKGNFVETMLRLGRERNELRIVNDQYCTPTSVADLATWLIALAKSTQYGLYHATNTGSTTWAEFAQEIFQSANLSTRVMPIPAAEYPTKARRPGYSVLNTDQLSTTLSIPLNHWKAALHTYLAERQQQLDSVT